MKIALAILFFLAGLIRVIDWITFSVQDKYNDLGWEEFKLRYLEHLPSILRPLFERPLLITAICIALFTIAGLIFIKETDRLLKVLGIISFILGFWQLFSLM